MKKKKVKGPTKKQREKIAAEIKSEAEMITEQLEYFHVPCMSDEITTQTLALMCVAAMGENNVDHEAVDLFMEMMNDAYFAVLFAQMVAKGKMYPSVIDGELGFNKGPMWTEEDAEDWGEGEMIDGNFDDDLYDGDEDEDDPDDDGTDISNDSKLPIK